MLRSKCWGERQEGSLGLAGQLEGPWAHLTAYLANLVNSRPSHRLYFKIKVDSP